MLLGAFLLIKGSHLYRFGHLQVRTCIRKENIALALVLARALVMVLARALAMVLAWALALVPAYQAVHQLVNQ